MRTLSKQEQSNRQNAQKSTGPKTEAGKSTVSLNAVKHGLTARDVVLNAKHYRESEDEYNALVTNLMFELAPSGQFQKQLVLKIANALWRSRRVIRAETAHINDRINDIDRYFRTMDAFAETMNKVTKTDNYTETDEKRRAKLEGLVGDHLLPTECEARRLLHYEMRLDRQISRAYLLLRHLQWVEKNDQPMDDAHETRISQKSKKQQNKPISSELPELHVLTRK